MPRCSFVVLLAGCAPTVPADVVDDPTDADLPSVCTVSVPTDYATLADAVAAVSPGHDTLICLGAGTFEGAKLHGIHLRGAGRALTRVSGTLELTGNASVQDLVVGRIHAHALPADGHTDTIEVYDTTVEPLDSTEPWAMLVTSLGSHPTATVHVVMRRDEVAYTGTGLEAIAGGETPLVLDVQSSYFPGRGIGVSVSTFKFESTLNATIDACTFAWTSEALVAQIGTATSSLEYKDDVFYDSSKRAVYVDAPTATVTHSHNAWWENADDGTATTGHIHSPSDVTSDPMLTHMTAPPRPEAGSPLLFAGVKRGTTAEDYDGVPRPDPPTIGAVQSVAAGGDSGPCGDTGYGDSY